MASQQNKAVPLILGSFCLMMFVGAQAREFTVGNSRWRVQSNSTESYNQWAERNRFQIGDSLVFVYRKDDDSVLYVTKEAYDNCNTKGALAKYTDGHTVVPLNTSGPHYFISGEKDNCLNGEKIHVIVMADRSNKNATPPPPPPPSPLAPAPTPSGVTADSNPTPAPPPPSPSAASLTAINVGSVAAFLGLASLLL